MLLQSQDLKRALQPYCVGGPFGRLLDAEAERLGETHYQGIEKIWKKVREKLGMPKLRIHDLRHSFAAVGATHGQSLPIIGAILGHREVSTTQRYAHLSDMPVKQATDDISAMISVAMRGQPLVKSDTEAEGSPSFDKTEVADLIANLQQLLKVG